MLECRKTVENNKETNIFFFFKREENRLTKNKGKYNKRQTTLFITTLTVKQQKINQEMKSEANQLSHQGTIQRTQCRIQNQIANEK